MRVDGPEGRRYEHETGHDAEEGGSEEAEASLAADRGGGRPLPRGGWRSHGLDRLPRDHRQPASGRQAPPLPASGRDARLRQRRHAARRVLHREALPGSDRADPADGPLRLHRGRRLELLPPQGRRLPRDRPRRRGELHRRRGRARRQHDHAAGREGAAADAREELRAQGEGDPARAPPRAAAEQGRDPLPLPEPHLPRQRRLRRRRRVAGVLRQGRRRPDARGSRAARGLAASAEPVLPDPALAAREESPALRPRADGARGLHQLGGGAAGAERADPARPRRSEDAELHRRSLLRRARPSLPRGALRRHRALPARSARLHDLRPRRAARRRADAPQAHRRDRRHARAREADPAARRAPRPRPSSTASASRRPRRRSPARPVRPWSSPRRRKAACRCRCRAQPAG